MIRREGPSSQFCLSGALSSRLLSWVVGMYLGELMDNDRGHLCLWGKCGREKGTEEGGSSHIILACVYHSWLSWGAVFGFQHTRDRLIMLQGWGEKADWNHLWLQRTQPGNPGRKCRRTLASRAVHAELSGFECFITDFSMQDFDLFFFKKEIFLFYCKTCCHYTF